MSRDFKANPGPETGVRQLIANGKFKAALEAAKGFHKSAGTAASESLLLDAYAARIQALSDQNLTVEAKALMDLVQERFPGAKERLERVKMAMSAQGGDLGPLLAPLNDPQLSPERRASVEAIVQTQVSDLTALAECQALAPEHALRQAAGAIDRAFKLVTSGPVTDEQIALPEVSHRSPLAPWKLLVRAIANLHRGEDDACGELLSAIKPESVPGRLVPAMRAMLGAKPAGALKPAESALLNGAIASLADLRSALANVDREFTEDNDDRIFKAARAAVRECQRSAPDQLGELKQLIGVRARVAGLDEVRMNAALDGAAKEDAAYIRMYARALEASEDFEDIALSCEAWDGFRLLAVHEGWFKDNGPEVAILYLHMAELLERLPPGKLREIRDFQGSSAKGSEDRYFLFPEKVYARASAIDPEEGFPKWMAWALGQSESKAEDVAREWHRVRKEDLEPLLFLMDKAGKRKAFPAALKYLEDAERVDAVHPVVRAARLRLLVASAIRHLQQKKPHLAAEKLAAVAELPQSKQGDRPAAVAALRSLVCLRSGEGKRAIEYHAEMERILGGKIAPVILFYGMADACRMAECAEIPPAKGWGRDQQMEIPAAMAKVTALVDDLGIQKFRFPVSYLDAAEALLPAVQNTLNPAQIRCLGELGMSTDSPKLAWAAAGAGLAGGGPSEAGFLLLRARALPGGDHRRYMALTGAAAELGRFHHDSEVVSQAVEIGRDPFGDEPMTVTIEQAREVIRRELASPAFPNGFTKAPDYSDLFGDFANDDEPCDCPECRRERGEFARFDAVDEVELKRIFDQHAPKDLPPDMLNDLFRVLKEAYLSGVDPEEILSQVMGESKKRGNEQRGKERRKR